MTTIQRWTACVPGSAQTASVVPDPNGKFVRFADHEHEIAQFARRIETLTTQIEQIFAQADR